MEMLSFTTYPKKLASRGKPHKAEDNNKYFFYEDLIREGYWGFLHKGGVSGNRRKFRQGSFKTLGNLK
jgi:hypothetical protein